MKQSSSKIVFDPRCLAHAVLLWCMAALFFLLLSASAITLADLKASTFPAFSFCTLAAASFFAVRHICRCTSAPGWLTALIFALTTTIFLLSCGFLISGKEIRGASVLAVAGGNVLGSFSGSVLAGKGKKLQLRKRFKRR